MIEEYKIEPTGNCIEGFEFRNAILAELKARISYLEFSQPSIQRLMNEGEKNV